MQSPGIAGARSSSAQQGFALVVVIVIMLLISFLAGQLILNVRAELRVAANAKDRAVGLTLAHAGINLALFRILDKPVDIVEDEDEIFVEGYGYDGFLPTGHFRYYVVNESGKIDLNAFNPTLLEYFLEYMQIDAPEREIIIDSLYDWQDSDNLHRLQGAELETYQELDDPYIPRNGKIVEPSEFFLVHGTAPLAGRFVAADVFTTRNRSNKVNFNSLTPLMLDFLTEDDEEKKKAYREAQELYGNLTEAQARQILGETRFSQVGDALVYSAGNNKFYTVVVRGEPGVDEQTLIDREEEGLAPPVGHEVRALFELRGSKITYYGWQEGWS